MRYLKSQNLYRRPHFFGNREFASLPAYWVCDWLSGVYVQVGSRGDTKAEVTSETFVTIFFTYLAGDSAGHEVVCPSGNLYHKHRTSQGKKENHYISPGTKMSH